MMATYKPRPLWQAWSTPAVVVLLACWTLSAHAQTPTTTFAPGSRIAELERVVAALQNEVTLLQHQGDSFDMVEDIGLAECDAGCDGVGCGGCGQTSCDHPSHYVAYDNGWVIRPRDATRTPFELRFNVHNQFRYTGFANTNEIFVDSAGNPVPINPRNDFDINRGRFVLSGYAWDPRLEFYTNIDYNTVATNPVLLLLSWMSYRFSDALTVRVGLVKVPGTWEWQETSRYTLGTERTLATTFFRPSITAGIWAQGSLGDSIFYHALVGDGFNTFTLRAAELDTNLAYSALAWWEPLEAFGVGFSDLEYHESLGMRIGHGFTFAANDANAVGEPGPEQTVIRLSDGTRLVEPGALAAGATVNQFDITLYSVHLGLKRRGVSFATEYFFRWLTSLEATGPLPVDSIFDHGFFAQGGVFVVPQRLELYALGSHVSGDHGNGHQVGAGFNWYVQGQRGARFSFDVTQISDSPAQQDRTGFVAGASGVLFRAQWWHFF